VPSSEHAGLARSAARTPDKSLRQIGSSDDDAVRDDAGLRQMAKKIVIIPIKAAKVFGRTVHAELQRSERHRQDIIINHRNIGTPNFLLVLLILLNGSIMYVPHTIDNPGSRKYAADTQPMQGRIQPLDGVRAIAILMVIICHALESTPSLKEYYRFYVALGQAGVNLFFVLSGYLITSQLVKEHQVTGKIDLVAFLRHRVLRIFPAYYAFLIIMGIISLLHVGVHITSKELFMDAVFLRNYYLEHAGFWTAHAWSLSIEQQFYLLWPAALALLGLRNGLRYAVVGMVLDPFIRLGTYAIFPGQRDLITTMFHTRMDILLYGCALAIIIAKPKNFISNAVAKHGNLLLCTAIFVFILGLLLEATVHGYGLTVDFSISGVVVAAIIAYLLMHPSSAFTRALSYAPITWLGRISYSLYLWQQPFFNPLDQSMLARFPFDIIAALLLATASYYGIEKPFIAWGSRRKIAAHASAEVTYQADVSNANTLEAV
jgi:peptidoglycan/LPS O-acetylase OafA/YrhL